MTQGTISEHTLLPLIAFITHPGTTLPPDGINLMDED
jgi:hypothetical protein